MAGEIVRKYRECPCKECAERTSTCHAACRMYTGWMEEEQAMKHRKWEEEQRYAISDTKRRWIIQNMKRRRK